MPYKDLNDLPKSVQEHLPKHAQEIYRAGLIALGTNTGKTKNGRTGWLGVRSKKNIRRMNLVGNGQL
jgi:cation transport regulator